MAGIADAEEIPSIVDPNEIGWWIESADEEVYGPVSRGTLRRFLEEGDVSPNTLVRHATQAEARPLADQPGMMEGVTPNPAASPLGDRLAEVWPRKTRDRLVLAEGTLPCARHNRKAISYCVRCHAPYCPRCRARPLRRVFYCCRHCQSSSYNRRIVAYLVDAMLFTGVPVFAVMPLVQAAGPGLVTLVQLVGSLVFIVRDAVFRGAGPGKRLVGLRVVQTKDGSTPLTYGQGVVRWVSLAIPFFNLFDMSVPYRDPLQRRYGDRWAGTRVLDSERTLAKARAKVQNWLARKGVTLGAAAGEMKIEQFAQLE